MNSKNIKNYLNSEFKKELFKSKLNSFTDENDHLVNSLKKPSGILRAA